MHERLDRLCEEASQVIAESSRIRLQSRQLLERMYRQAVHAVTSDAAGPSKGQHRREETAAPREFGQAYVSTGSKADKAPSLDFIRFAPESGQTRDVSGCPLCAISDRMQRSK